MVATVLKTNSTGTVRVGLASMLRICAMQRRGLTELTHEVIALRHTERSKGAVDCLLKRCTRERVRGVTAPGPFGCVLLHSCGGPFTAGDLAPAFTAGDGWRWWRRGAFGSRGRRVGISGEQ